MAPVAVSTILVVEPACTRTPQYGQVIVFAVISFWEWPSKSILLSLSYLFLLRRLVRTLFQIFIYIIGVFIHKLVFRDIDATDINLAGDGISNNLVLIFFKHSNFFCQLFDCSIVLGQSLLYIFTMAICSSAGGTMNGISFILSICKSHCPTRMPSDAWAKNSHKPYCGWHSEILQILKSNVEDEVSRADDSGIIRNAIGALPSLHLIHRKLPFSHNFIAV